MEPRLNTLIVMVSDMNRSLAFYRDILGLKSRTESEWWSEFSSGDVTIALHHARQGAGGAVNGTDAGTVHISFAVTNIERASADLRAKGVEVDGPKEMEGILTATFSDPDGLSLGLEQR